jgi:hypothetical protein
MPRTSDLEVGQTSNSKNKLVNADKRWHITHSVEYQVQWSNSIFVQLQYMQAPKYKCYFCREYHKRSDSFEIVKLKGSHICVLTFVQKYHHQFYANFIASAISTIVMNNLSMMVAGIRDEIKLHYKYKISYDKA